MTDHAHLVERRGDADRRREERHPVGGRIHWTRAGRSLAFTGWLSDVSDSSVSFISSSRNSLRPGEEIEVTKDSGGLPPHFQIIRITPFDEKLSLIACRAMTPSSGSGFAPGTSPLTH